MLTDTKLRNLKPKDKEYKVADRDGLYVQVLTSGTLSFRYNYRLNGRGETVTFGRYGVITLAQAREKLDEAKKLIAEGKSPSREKVRDKARDSESKTFDQWAQSWLKGYEMAESTRDARTATYRRHLQEKFGTKPRWPPQTAPLMAGQTAPGRTSQL